MEGARFGDENGEVPRGKCGSSHSLQSGRNDCEVGGLIGDGDRVVDGSVSDNVGVCSFSGVSDCLESRTCLVDSGFDVSGVEPSNLRSVDESGVGVVDDGHVSRADHDVSGADVDKSLSGSVNDGSTYGDMPFDDGDWISDLFWEGADDGADDGPDDGPDEGADEEEEDDAEPVSPAKESDKVDGGADPSTPVKKTGDWTSARRTEVKRKYKEMMCWKKDERRGTSDYGRREKTIVLTVKAFNEGEKKAYKKRLRIERDNYVKEAVRDMTVVPFEKVVERTSAMTGISERCVARFVQQERRSELTPKKKTGRKGFVAPEWILTDIRIIITG